MDITSHVEGLEPRNLFAAAPTGPIFLKGTNLRVNGDTLIANVIDVTLDPAAGTVVASLKVGEQAPVTMAFPTKKVKSIRIDGGGGNDTIRVGTDAAPLNLSATINGKAGDDVITTTGSKPDTISGGAGDDEIRSAGGNDDLRGDDGDDTLIGGGGNDTLLGGPGDDRLEGEGGKDLLGLQDGRDRAFGGSGGDTFKILLNNDEDPIFEDFDRDENDRKIYVLKLF